jgi:hypothetical protein
LFVVLVEKGSVGFWFSCKESVLVGDSCIVSGFFSFFDDIKLYSLIQKKKEVGVGRLGKYFSVLLLV